MDIDVIHHPAKHRMGRVVEESNQDFGTKLYEYDKAGNLHYKNEELGKYFPADYLRHSRWNSLVSMDFYAETI